jgi:DNA primase
VWLLLYRCEGWDALSAETQELLAEQPAPYGPAFSLIERQLHEHGALGYPALVEELRRADADPATAALVNRLAELHELAADVDAEQELRIVMERLLLQSVEEELRLLFESGDLSPQAQQRGRELVQRRAQLKAQSGSAAPS